MVQAWKANKTTVNMSRGNQAKRRAGTCTAHTNTAVSCGAAVYNQFSGAPGHQSG